MIEILKPWIGKCIGFISRFLKRASKTSISTQGGDLTISGSTKTKVKQNFENNTHQADHHGDNFESVVIKNVNVNVYVVNSIEDLNKALESGNPRPFYLHEVQDSIVLKAVEKDSEGESSK